MERLAAHAARGRPQKQANHRRHTRAGAAFSAGIPAVVARSAQDVDEGIGSAVATVLGWAPGIWRRPHRWTRARPHHRRGRADPKAMVAAPRPTNRAASREPPRSDLARSATERSCRATRACRTRSFGDADGGEGRRPGSGGGRGGRRPAGRPAHHSDAERRSWSGMDRTSPANSAATPGSSHARDRRTSAGALAKARSTSTRPSRKCFQPS